MTVSPWTITSQQVIDSPEVSVLVFHNVYPEGKQGGVELIQHGERIATNGDVRLEAVPGQWSELPVLQEALPRQADAHSVAVRLQYASAAIAYTVRVRPVGGAIEVAVDLDQPVPAQWQGKLAFQLELFPGAFMGKTYWMDHAFGAFSHQANGPVATGPGGGPLPMARGRRLIAAPDDPLCRLEIVSHTGELELIDGRSARRKYFSLRSATTRRRRSMR